MKCPAWLIHSILFKLQLEIKATLSNLHFVSFFCSKYFYYIVVTLGAPTNTAPGARAPPAPGSRARVRYVHSRSRARGSTRCPRAPLTPLGSLWSFVKPYLGGNP